MLVLVWPGVSRISTAQLPRSQARVLADEAGGVGEFGAVEERRSFACRAALRVGDDAVELVHLGMKFRGRAGEGSVPPDFDALRAEKGVAADVVEMFFGIEYAQAVFGPDGGGVSMDGLPRQRVAAGIHHQRLGIPGDEAGIHAPGRRVGKTGDGVATRRQAHSISIARRVRDFAGARRQYAWRIPCDSK
jgi:hypothetical protein